MKKKFPNSFPSSFLQKIFHMLSNPDIDSIVSWSESGLEFIIHSLPDFSEQVLPIYFKHKNFPSFIRQLNMYDFHKVRSNLYGYMFAHPLFKKERPELMKRIMRKNTEKAEVNQIPQEKPEFFGFYGKLGKITKKQKQLENKIGLLNEEMEKLNKNNLSMLDEMEVNKNSIKRILGVFEIFKRNSSQGNLNLFPFTQSAHLVTKDDSFSNTLNQNNENEISTDEFPYEFDTDLLHPFPFSTSSPCHNTPDPFKYSPYPENSSFL